jgi:hypothetical protein
MGRLTARAVVLQRTGDSVGHAASWFLKGSTSQTGQALAKCPLSLSAQLLDRGGIGIRFRPSVNER